MLFIFYVTFVLALLNRYIIQQENTKTLIFASYCLILNLILTEFMIFMEVNGKFLWNGVNDGTGQLERAKRGGTKHMLKMRMSLLSYIGL